MAITDVHGSQLTVINTEHTLADTSAAGAYGASVDLSPMVDGDIVELRVYRMELTAGTRRVLYFARICDAQPVDDPPATFPPVETALADSGAIRFSLKQTAGSVRTFAWSLKKVA